MIHKIKNLNKHQKQEHTSTDMLLNVTHASLLKELSGSKRKSISDRYTRT